MTASTILSPDDTRSLRRERDQLESELQAVHEAYRNMFNMYDQLKLLNKDLKEVSIFTMHYYFEVPFLLRIMTINAT